MEERIIIFDNVHHTLSGEKALLAEGVALEVVPIPPYVNEGCGLGIKIANDILGMVLAILKKHKIKVEKVV